MDELEDRQERKKAVNALKESENKYRIIFDNSGTAMIIVEEDDTISLANREFEIITGDKKKEIENKKNWIDFIHGDDQKRILELKKSPKKYLRDSSDHREIRLINRNNEVRDVIVNLAPLSEAGKYIVSFLDITDRKKTEIELRNSENELRLKTLNLEEANTALKVLLRHREEDQNAMEQKVISNVNKLVLPYVEKLKGLRLNDNQAMHLEIIETHLKDIVSPFLRNLTTEHYDLTPREIQIASLVKEGKTTKEITELLNISATAVDFHRKNIRLKLGIKNKKANLRSFLHTMHS